MGAAPLVSILMPAFHSESFIARSVQSVLAQTHKEWELVIAADDGVDYANVLAEQGIRDSRIVHASTNGLGRGTSIARNAALDRATGDIIAVLDSDDLFHSGKLERCLPLVKEHGFMFTAYQEVPFGADTSVRLSSNAGLVTSRLLDQPEDIWLLLLIITNVTSVHDRLRLPIRWHAELSVLEDTYFMLEAYAYLKAPYFRDEVLHYYVNRPGSTTHSVNTSQRFLEGKKKLLQLLNEPSSPIPASIQKEVKQFLGISLRAEEEYARLPYEEGLFRRILLKHIDAAEVNLPPYIRNLV